jgi:hypothetical protein
VSVPTSIRSIDNTTGMTELHSGASIWKYTVAGGSLAVVVRAQATTAIISKVRAQRFGLLNIPWVEHIQAFRQ